MLFISFMTKILFLNPSKIHILMVDATMRECFLMLKLWHEKHLHMIWDLGLKRLLHSLQLIFILCHGHFTERLPSNGVQTASIFQWWWSDVCIDFEIIEIRIICLVFCLPIGIINMKSIICSSDGTSAHLVMENNIEFHVTDDFIWKKFIPIDVLIIFMHWNPINSWTHS